MKVIIPGTKKMVGQIRREWELKPVTKPHSTKKGKKGYKREKIHMFNIDLEY